MEKKVRNIQFENLNFAIFGGSVDNFKRRYEKINKNIFPGKKGRYSR